MLFAENGRSNSECLNDQAPAARRRRVSCYFGVLWLWGSCVFCFQVEYFCWPWCAAMKRFLQKSRSVAVYMIAAASNGHCSQFNTVNDEVFRRCVHGFRANTLTEDERKCIQAATGKYIKTAVRVGQRFVEQQTAQQKKMVWRSALRLARSFSRTYWFVFGNSWYHHRWQSSSKQRR